MKLDKTLDAVTIRAVGPEDRAMLRSNPSAVADAGMRAIGSGTGDCAPAPSHTTGRTVFRIRRLDPAAYRAARPADRR